MDVGVTLRGCRPDAEEPRARVRPKKAAGCRVGWQLDGSPVVSRPVQAVVPVVLGGVGGILRQALCGPSGAPNL
jgi:hypothetical protein